MTTTAFSRKKVPGQVGHAFLDTIDLAANIKKALAAVNGLHGSQALTVALFFIAFAAVDAAFCWYFDIQPTVVWSEKVTAKILPTLPAFIVPCNASPGGCGAATAIEIGGAATILAVLVTLLPTLTEITMSRLAAAGARSVGLLLYMVLLFDFNTDWPRVVEFTEQFRTLFNGLGIVTDVAFFIARVLFLFLASMGFEIILILCAVCIVRLLLNAIGFGGGAAAATP